MARATTGIGLGLRYDLAQELLERMPQSVSWLEVHPENYIDRGGRYEQNLERARAHWSVVTHGLTACFGASEPIDAAYLLDLRGFLRRLEVPWHSEHLCVGGAQGRFLHDLLPLPFTEEAASNAARKRAARSRPASAMTAII